jgi:hypothetical protein
VSFMWRNSIDDSAPHDTYSGGDAPVWSPYRQTAPYRQTTFKNSRDLTDRAQQYYQTGRFGHTGDEPFHQDAPPSSSEADEMPEASTFFDTSSVSGGERTSVGMGRSSVPSSEHARETDLSKLYEQLSYQGKEMANIIRALDNQGIDRSTVLPDRASDVNVTASLDMQQVWVAQEELPNQHVRTSYVLNQGDIALIRQMYPGRNSQVFSEPASDRRGSVTSTYQQLAGWSFGDQPVQGGNTEMHYE